MIGADIFDPGSFAEEEHKIRQSEQYKSLPATMPDADKMDIINQRTQQVFEAQKAKQEQDRLAAENERRKALAAEVIASSGMSKEEQAKYLQQKGLIDLSVPGQAQDLQPPAAIARPEEIDQLEQQGAVSPEVAAQMRMRIPQGPGDYGMGGISNEMRKHGQDVRRQFELYKQSAADITERRKKSIDDQAELEYMKAQDMANIEAEKRRSMELLDAEERRNEEIRKGRLADVEVQLQNETEKSRKGFFEGDEENSAFRRKGMAALAVALGGLAQMYNPNQRNVALDIINQKIDEDLKKKRMAVSDKQGELGRLKEQFGDERTAESVYRLKQLEGFRAQVEQTASEYKGPEMQARLGEVMAGIDDQVNKERISILEKQDAMNRASLAGQLQIAGSRMSVDAAQRQAAMAQADPRKFAVPGMQLTGEKIPSEEDVKKVGEARIESSKVFDLLDRIEAHVNKEGRTFWFTDADESGKALARELHLALKGPAMHALGILAGPDLELLESVFPKDPGSMRQDRVRNAISRTRGILGDNWSRKSRQYGYQETELGSAGVEALGIRPKE